MSHASTSLGELINHVRRAVNLNDFSPSLNKPVFEFTHGLVLCTSSRGRDVSYGSPGATGSSAGKESTCNAGDSGWIPGLGRSSGEGHGNPFQYSCLENLCGKKSLGYSPWGHKESDMTEWLSTAQGPLAILYLSEPTAQSLVNRQPMWGNKLTWTVVSMWNWPALPAQISLPLKAH